MSSAGSAKATEAVNKRARKPIFFFINLLLFCFTLLSFRNTVEIFMTAQYEIFPCQRWRSIERLTQCVGRQNLQLLAALDHDRRSIPSGQIYPSVCRHWRRIYPL